jgi:hypothetical protein
MLKRVRTFGTEIPDTRIKSSNNKYKSLQDIYPKIILDNE